MKLIAYAMRTSLTLLVAASTAVSAVASPGAHGPNGEHLDQPAVAAGGPGTFPKLEAQFEQFELVATLGRGELSLLIDRFQTNEPVLNARVEVESGKLKADAKFHADHGDYAVDDPAMLKALGQPGAHQILITLIAGKESDLLEGTLNVTAPVSRVSQGHSHADGGAHGASEGGHGHGAAWQLPSAAITALAGLGGLAVLRLAAFWWQRRKRPAKSIEVLP